MQRTWALVRREFRCTDLGQPQHSGGAADGGSCLGLLRFQAAFAAGAWMLRPAYAETGFSAGRARRPNLPVFPAGRAVPPCVGTPEERKLIPAARKAGMLNFPLVNRAEKWYTVCALYTNQCRRADQPPAAVF